MARIVEATSEWIQRAGHILSSGGLVAFPTETVYGLGANALDQSAVAKIFLAKGRPATNPIIVHVASVDDLTSICDISNPHLQSLADAFWPGPLTLVLPKLNSVPDNVTAGGNTVGVRIPNHPVALDLIKQSGCPIAAPSANRSEEISPTTAQHVADSLGGTDILILDGGRCQVGIESTVLDLSSDKPRILRPGQITADQIETVIGMKLAESKSANNDETIAMSPGQMPRHYAPRKPLYLTKQSWEPKRYLKIEGVYPEKISNGRITRHYESRPIAFNPSDYAQSLYAALHRFDNDPDVIAIEVEEPPDTPEWTAVRDRLLRAATPKE